jgi:uncharacterized membrane protein YoaK (UPF0700 family)
MKDIIIAILIIILWILGTVCGIEAAKIKYDMRILGPLWIICFVIYVIILILNFKR